MTIENTFLTTLQDVVKNKPVTLNIAYSGGVDSHVLLYLCARAFSDASDVQLQAIHINHGLSPNADVWQAHCESECKALGVDFVAVKVDVDGQAGNGLEAAARDARYQALYSICQPGSVLLLGQHRNDQLETLLLQLKRGAGPKGLAAMAARSQARHGTTTLRPLLDVSRSEIEAFARENGFTWQEDESNLNKDFDRNFLRLDIIPLLEARWPGIASAASRTARLCAKQQSLIEDICATRLERLIADDGGLSIHDLLNESPQWRSEIVRFWLTTRQVEMPSEKILNEFEKLFVARDDANPLISWGDNEIRRFNNFMYLVPKCTELEAFDVDLQTNPQIALHDEMGRLVFTPDINHSVSVRIGFGGFGQRFKPAGEKMSKPLSQWFKLWRIPPWERARTALIYIDEKLVALVSKEGLTTVEQFGELTGNSIQLRLERP